MESDTRELYDQVVQLGRPPNRVDLITPISGVNFDEVWSTREKGDLEGICMPFISKELLIRNKAASGRDKDLLDLKLLKQNLNDV